MIQDGCRTGDVMMFNWCKRKMKTAGLLVRTLIRLRSTVEEVLATTGVEIGGKVTYGRVVAWYASDLQGPNSQGCYWNYAGSF